MSPIGKLLGEIHRRSLWQTLGVYLAGSWVVLQVIDILVDSLELPRWLPAMAILLILAGLPLILATAFLQGGFQKRRAEGEVSSQALLAEGEGSAAERDSADPHSADIEIVALRLFTWRHAVTGGVVAFGLWGVIVAGWLVLAGPVTPGAADRGLTVDQDLVAVFPFHVAGTESLAYLGEGMVDLLAAKLTGEGGLRAADPRAVISVWHTASPDDGQNVREETALRLGRSLGAGRVLLGGIVETPAGLVLSAAVFHVDDESQEAQASVEGPADSLTVLVDELVIQLLARETGERDQRLAALTSTSLQALRAYLEGQAAYRRGGYSEADRHFESALQEDSTFALAALAWVSSAWWSAGSSGSTGHWRSRNASEGA